MLVNVRRHELRDGLCGVELIQVQPLMLEQMPPGLDHRIGAVNLRLGQDAPENT